MSCYQLEASLGRPFWLHTTVQRAKKTIKKKREMKHRELVSALLMPNGNIGQVAEEPADLGNQPSWRSFSWSFKEIDENPEAQGFFILSRMHKEKTLQIWIYILRLEGIIRSLALTSFLLQSTKLHQVTWCMWLTQRQPVLMQRHEEMVIPVLFLATFLSFWSLSHS